MPDRYYSETPIAGPVTTLTGNEAHHLLHVMRAKPGLELIVFDGQGGECEAEVTRCGRTEVELQLGERLEIERELTSNLTLAVALPKGDRQRRLVEKLVELGVTRLVPLKTVRSVSKAEKSDKLNRYVIAASKQCGRNRLMEILPPVDWPTFVRAESTERRFVAHPGGKSLSELSIQPLKDTVIALGPEGGFAEEEIELAATAGWETVGLGSRILRIETAAIAMVSLIALGFEKT